MKSYNFLIRFYKKQKIPHGMLTRQQSRNHREVVKITK